LQHNGKSSTPGLQPPTPIYLGDRLETGDADKAEIVFKDGTTLRLGFNTALEIPNPKSEIRNPKSPLSRPPEINLLRGQVWTKVQKMTNALQYAIRTVAATAVARGTEFGVKLERPKSGNPSTLTAVLTVKEGAVDFSNSLGSVQATAMTESTASADSAPSQPVLLQTIENFGLSTGEKWSFGLSHVFDSDRWMYRMVYPQGWAGFSLRSVSDPQDVSAAQLRVVRVWSASPAEQAGLAVGDLITHVNGRHTTNIQEVLQAVFRQEGATVAMGITRGESSLTVSLRTTNHPYALPFNDVSPDLAQDLFDATWPMIATAAQGLIVSNEWRQVAQQFEGFLERHPNVPALHNNLGLWYDLYEEVGPAIRYLGPAAAGQPDNPLYRYNLGMILASIGNVERAAEEAEAVVRLSPEWVPGIIELAEIYTVLDRYEEALATLERGLSAHPSCPDLWGAKYLVLLHLGRRAEALAAALKAVELEPSYAQWWWRLKLVYTARGERAQAEAAARRVIELDPGFAVAYDGLAVTIMQGLGDRLPDHPMDAQPEELAIEHWRNRPAEEQAIIAEAERLERKAIELLPGRGSFYGNLGLILLSRGAVDEADKVLGKAMELDPNGQGASAPNSLAYHLALWGIRLDDALRLAQEAIRLAPDGYTFDTLAVVHFRRGEWDQAEAAWKKCIEAAGPKGDPGAWFRLGRLYERKNQTDAAIKAYAEALKFRPDFPQASGALERLRR
jgi:tetratricopeptide (TPR) repeat protein